MFGSSYVKNDIADFKFCHISQKILVAKSVISRLAQTEVVDLFFSSRFDVFCKNPERRFVIEPYFYYDWSRTNNFSYIVSKSDNVPYFTIHSSLL